MLLDTNCRSFCIAVRPKQHNAPVIARYQLSVARKQSATAFSPVLRLEEFQHKTSQW
jgi:hypothetical protein